MVSTCMKRNHQKKPLSQLNETFKDFNFGNRTIVNPMENETLEQLTNGQHKYFERFVDSASQKQVIENDIDDKIRTAVDNAALTVVNRMQDANLIAMEILRVEMAVKSITGSCGTWRK